MIKDIVIIAVLLAMLGYALTVMCITAGSKDTYESYKRWKEHRNER